jgi:hypothetical protein
MIRYDTASLDFLISRDLMTRGILNFIDYQPPMKVRHVADKLSNHQVRIEIDQLKIFDYYDYPHAPDRQHFYKVEILPNNFKVILDWSTGLMWQCEGREQPASHDLAMAYMEQMNHTRRLGGFDNWRLPTVAEAASLIERHPIDDLHINFAFSRAERYIWTSDYVDDNEAWVVSYFQGFVMHDLRTKDYFVRLVRTI